MDFYERFIKLCAEKGIKPSPMLESIGIKKTAASNWKKRQTAPTACNLQKIADYFGVSVEYLRCETDLKEKPPIGIDERLKELYNMTEGLNETDIIALKSFVAGLKANRQQD